MKKTQIVSVFPVGYSGGLKYEGPVCENGKVEKWRAHYAPERFVTFCYAYYICILKLLFLTAIYLSFLRGIEKITYICTYIIGLPSGMNYVHPH